MELITQNIINIIIHQLIYHCLKPKNLIYLCFLILKKNFFF